MYVRTMASLHGQIYNELPQSPGKGVRKVFTWFYVFLKFEKLNYFDYDS